MMFKVGMNRPGMSGEFISWRMKSWHVPRGTRRAQGASQGRSRVRDECETEPRSVYVPGPSPLPRGWARSPSTNATAKKVACIREALTVWL